MIRSGVPIYKYEWNSIYPKASSGVNIFRFVEKKIWAPIAYEKLPKFCFKCGTIQHPPDYHISKDESDPYQFGPWLRAEQLKRRAFHGLGSSGGTLDWWTILPKLPLTEEQRDQTDPEIAPSQPNV